MATNILLLPFVTFQAATENNADWNDSIAFTNNGAPIDITGIAFIHTWRSASKPNSTVRPLAISTAGGTMINGGSTGVLSMAAPKAVMFGAPPDTYDGDLIAIAEGHTLNLSATGLSTITHNQGVS